MKKIDNIELFGFEFKMVNFFFFFIMIMCVDCGGLCVV